jgi:hypothetical protein
MSAPAFPRRPRSSSLEPGPPPEQVAIAERLSDLVGELADLLFD